ncbi:uncharacterized protein LOC123652536 isoform X2 [Pipistrellus kuhlii]|uniref:uncharacterized protein LOC123652536 isoform X2 n=1 Tax=Pipistrellus kuhlii TaxID=59472 RepID=UPI001E26F575|nr:uncharacterized protein LOC123652536 isoform X2 [Pipistrellus kuhlii]
MSRWLKIQFYKWLPEDSPLLTPVGAQQLWRWSQDRNQNQIDSKIWTLNSYKSIFNWSHVGILDHVNKSNILDTGEQANGRKLGD